jgi:hypothetical protein
MKDHESRRADVASVGEKVRAFYERHPYPPPIDSLEKYRRFGQDRLSRQVDLSLLACEILQGRPIHPDCRLRDIAGGQACFALARGSGHRHRLQRNECALY